MRRPSGEIAGASAPDRYASTIACGRVMLYRITRAGAGLRSHPHVARVARTTTSATSPPSADMNLLLERMETADASPTALKLVSTSAAEKSAADTNLSAGNFSRARDTAASTCDGIVRRCVRIGRGVSVITRATIAC